MSREKDEDPGLPIKFGPCSNAEYDPKPLTPFLKEVERRSRDECETNARRLGMSRREFMLSILGAATTLSVLDACTHEATRARSPGASPGGGYSIPPEAKTEPEAAHEAIGGEEFVFDIQGHLLEYDLNPVLNGQDFWQRFPQQGCGENDPRVCYSIENFLELMFLRSDTTMTVISSLPIYPKGSPESEEIIDETRKIVEGLCRDERVLMHAQALPNVGPLPEALDTMEENVRKYPIAAWKTFTLFPDVDEGNGDGWWFDDHEKGLPKVGEAFIRKAIDLGVPTIAAHKGFSGGSKFGSPEDVGRAAKDHPDANFVIYHSGYEDELREGPYSSGTSNIGINRLIASMKKNGIGPNENVYAELGSTWWNVMRSPEQAAHVLGKLIKYVGEDNVVWGTDCLFYGSPQDQIQALRSFRISEHFQRRYDYPELTREIKNKILGLNGARLYGIEPITDRCKFSRKELEQVRRHLPGKNRTLGPSTKAEAARFRDLDARVLSGGN
ncbi:MAG: amidohydrolase family protein [Actinomycetota bacterium]